MATVEAKKIVNPINLDEYKIWLDDQGYKIDSSTATYYELVALKIKNDFEKSETWKEITDNLKNFNDEYKMQNGYELLINDKLPELMIKPFDSFLIKTFRKNFLENENLPEPPKGGWYFPDNWCTRVNDIVRTSICVKYMDGASFLSNKILEISKDKTITCNGPHFEARDEGYYAVHMYLKNEFEIPKETFDTYKTPINVEIQITTQLQDVIKKLLHVYYEENRKATNKNKKWQWDHKSKEFSVSYLGHILHYVEGMILEVRDKQKEERNKYE